MPAQIILVLTGVWLVFAPWALGYDGAAATSDRITGPVLAAAAFLAVFAITRGLRWINLLSGLWLVTAPWLLSFPTDATISSMVCGVLALVLAPMGSLDQDRYGGGWMTLLRTERLPWPDGESGSKGAGGSGKHRGAPVD